MNVYHLESDKRGNPHLALVQTILTSTQTQGDHQKVDDLLCTVTFKKNNDGGWNASVVVASPLADPSYDVSADQAYAVSMDADDADSDVVYDFLIDGYTVQNDMIVADHRYELMVVVTVNGGHDEIKSAIAAHYLKRK
jgi:hypothetical protein